MLFEKFPEQKNDKKLKDYKIINYTFTGKIDLASEYEFFFNEILSKKKKKYDGKSHDINVTNA